MPSLVASGAVELLGLPTDEASSFVRGAALGPAAVRQALFSESSNLSTEVGTDIGRADRFLDLGDLELSGGARTRTEVETGVADVLRSGGRLVCLGGDHSVAYPILRAYGPLFEPLTVVQIDAHPDLYDEFEGDRFSHACPFARVMEEGLIHRLVQVGIRAATEHQREQAKRFGVEIVPRDIWGNLEALELEAPVYLSIDLDGFDPAYAPGVAHPEGGGLTPSAVLDLIWHAPGVISADIVELNPERDVTGATAVLAAKLVKELVARLLMSTTDIA